MIRENSPYICYKKLSPNKTSPRTKDIKRLTPHCMAGNLTIEKCLNLTKFLTPSSPGSSCNYAIGTDGRVGIGVIESDAAWTSSSTMNDSRAITFEIANNGGAPNWSISDLAINSFIKLAVDICKFYGFKRITYQEKPANIVTKTQVEEWIKTWEKPDEMILTLHRWYSSTACPGNYFISKIPYIVSKINYELSKKLTPYKVKIKVNTLNARRGPGTCFPIASTFKYDKAIHTIVEESSVDKDRGWGKLQSGLWIFLPYTEIIIPEDPKNVQYQIKITSNTLRVRKGPGTNYSIVRTLRNDKNTYTIIDEANGAGAKKWGKLKSGIGWISLDYTKKI